jgi:hypothetical protein
MFKKEISSSDRSIIHCILQQIPFPVDDYYREAAAAKNNNNSHNTDRL